MCKFCNSKDLIIRITVDYWNKETKKYQAYNDYEVNYCPMCGRKLGD